MAMLTPEMPSEAFPAAAENNACNSPELRCTWNGTAGATAVPMPTLPAVR